MKQWRQFLLRPILASSVLGFLIYSATMGFAEEKSIIEKYKLVKFDPLPEPEIINYRKKILIKWPKEKWKTYYVCNWVLKEIFSFQAPSDGKWNQCEIQKSKKGNECCYVDGFTPQLSLTYTDGDFSRMLNLGTEIFDRQMQVQIEGSEKKYKEAIKVKARVGESEIKKFYHYDGLKPIGKFLISGVTVFNIEKENWNYNSLGFAYHALAYDFDGSRGDIKASEFDKKSQFNDFIPLEQMVFTDLIYEIFKTAKILVPVKDWPEKRVDNTSPPASKKVPFTK